MATPDGPGPVMRHAGFVRLWIGQGLSQVGFQFSGLAMPVLAVTLLHASEQQLGYLNAAEFAAFLVLGLPAGGWVDRWLKRRTMLAADIIRGLGMALVPLLHLTGSLQMWHLFVVAGLVGCATVFFDVAYQSYLPILVPSARVADANGVLEATAQVARLGGPAVAGLLLRIVSAPLLLLVDAGSFLLSALSLFTIRDTEQPAARVRGRSLRTEIAEGIGFVWSQPLLRRLVLSTGLSNAAATCVLTLQPILVLRILQIAPEGFGLLLTLSALGGLVGSLVGPRLARRLGDGPTLVVATATGALSLALFPASALRPSWGLVVLGMASVVLGVSVIVYNVIQVSARQRLCPQHLLGRMNASIRFAVWGVMPPAALLAGWLGGAIGTVSTMWIAALLGLLTVLPLLLSRYAGMRTLPTEPE